MYIFFLSSSFTLLVSVKICYLIFVGKAEAVYMREVAFTRKLKVISNDINVLPSTHMCNLYPHTGEKRDIYTPDFFHSWCSVSVRYRKSRKRKKKKGQWLTEWHLDWQGNVGEEEEETQTATATATATAISLSLSPCNLAMFHDETNDDEWQVTCERQVKWFWFPPFTDVQWFIMVRRNSSEWNDQSNFDLLIANLCPFVRIISQE